MVVSDWEYTRSGVFSTYLESKVAGSTPQHSRAVIVTPQPFIDRTRRDRFLPNLVSSTECFVVEAKGVKCLVCNNPTVGYDVRDHIKKCKMHSKRLEDFEDDAAEGAVDVDEAEGIIAARTHGDGRKKRQKRHSVQPRDGAWQQRRRAWVW